MMSAEEFVDAMLKSMDSKKRTVANTPNEGVKQLEVQAILKEIQGKIVKGR